MATLLKGLFVSCVLLLILMEVAKPVLAKKKKLEKRVKKLEDSMEKVEDRLKELEECQACAKIKELNDAINKLKEEVNSKPASTVAGLEDSAILKKDASYLEALGDFLKPVVKSDSHWKRCWQASKDGWEAATFHSNCDGKGPSVTIIRVGRYIFGGYTSVSWNSRCTLHYDSAAFVYSIVNYPGWQPVKLSQTGQYSDEKKFAIYTCSSTGPVFGGGPAFYIFDNAGSNTYSFSDPGITYGPPSGYSYRSSFARSFLAGSVHFQPDEVEVFYETT